MEEKSERERVRGQRYRRSGQREMDQSRARAGPLDGETRGRGYMGGHVFTQIVVWDSVSILVPPPSLADQGA